MLDIYIGTNNRPKDLIIDAEVSFSRLETIVSNVTVFILKELENAQLLDNRGFIDKKGYKLPIDFLSTGSKILISVALSDECVNGDELGQNAFNILLHLTGKVYFTSTKRFEIPDHVPIDNIRVNGLSFSKMLDLENYLFSIDN